MTAVTDDTTEHERPRRPPGQLWLREVGVLVVLVAAVWSYSGINVSLSRLWSAPDDIWTILREMFPPDLTGSFVHRVYDKIIESVYIAWVGTVIAAILSLPLAFLAASNVAPTWVRWPIRQMFNAIRAFPELILAVLLLPITGLGAWTGTLAIGLHSIGTLGKLAMESIESVDGGPREAVDAAGGSWASAMRWGILPQVLPTIIAQWLFRFEINIRASVVLGVIGAGGVGSELISQLSFRQFDKAGTVLLLTIVVVLIIDTLSAAVRRRIIAGGGASGSADAEAVNSLIGRRT